MESVFIIIAAVVAFYWLLEELAETGSSASKEMSPLQAQICEKEISGNNIDIECKEIQIKGLFPISYDRHIGFVTSVFDNTGDKIFPIISALDSFQQQDSSIYEHSQTIGEVSHGQGFIDWVRAGVILPAILQPPYGGKRNLVAILRLVDLDNSSELIENKTIWNTTFEFDHIFSVKGYMEEVEHREEAQALSVKIAVAVALADGKIDDREGETIKNWIIKTISPFSEEMQARLKETYNEAMKESYEDIKAGKLDLYQIASRLNEIGEKNIKSDALELCHEVMEADGKIDKAEMAVIRSVAKELDIDMEEINKMRDLNIMNLSESLSESSDIESMLNIDTDWPNDRIKLHLRKEFQKWNNRFSSFPEGSEEKKKAQEMLNLISEARKKYD